MKPSERIAELRQLITEGPIEDIADFKCELLMFLRGDLPDWIEPEDEAYDAEGLFKGRLPDELELLQEECEDCQ